jgi:hypothetical protein
MERNPLKMQRADLTPTPVSVDVRSPDSGRAFVFERDHKAHTEQAYRSRGLMKGLLALTVVGAGLVGPELADTARDSGQSEVRAAVTRIEAETPPDALVRAQTAAALELFGTKGKAINVDAAREAANEPGTAKTLNVNSYVSPERVQVGKDGKFFTVDGQDYELARRQTAQGDVYVLAGRHFVEGGLLENRDRLVSLMMVGGAHNDRTSDLNNDGETTPAEVIQSADISARHNLDTAFQPPKYVVSKTKQK